MRSFHMRLVNLLRSNVKGAKSRAEEQIERIRHALIIEYISSLGLSFLCALFGGMPKAGVHHLQERIRPRLLSLCRLENREYDTPSPTELLHLTRFGNINDINLEKRWKANGCVEVFQFERDDPKLRNLGWVLR
jgi:hypothetical protein